MTIKNDLPTFVMMDTIAQVIKNDDKLGCEIEEEYFEALVEFNKDMKVVSMNAF